jgi:hypothetical protein
MRIALVVWTEPPDEPASSTLYIPLVERPTLADIARGLERLLRAVSEHELGALLVEPLPTVPRQTLQGLLNESALGRLSFVLYK